MAEHQTTQLADITAFLVAESAALDEHRHQDWLKVLTDDFRYVLPVPRSREDPTQSPYDMSTFLAHESKSFLEMRFARLMSDHAWAERPVPFVRHFVSNVQILESGTDDDGRDRWTVASNVLVVKSRLPEPTTITTAGRHDVIVSAPDGLRLQSRTVYIDTELPSDGQLGVIY